MIKPISGSSNITSFQLMKYSKMNNIEQDEILSLYIKYAMKYNIQIDVAYCMVLLYTNFFKNHIINNNIAGIGTQKNGTKLEEFNSIEDCIIAHCEILQKISSVEEIEKPHSNLYRRLENNSYYTSDKVYELFEYDTLTQFSVYDFGICLRELNRTRLDDVVWEENENFYYYIKIKSSKKRSELIKIRSDLLNKRFSSELISIIASNGEYILEMGKYTKPSDAKTLLTNLQRFGYTGEILFKRVN